MLLYSRNQHSIVKQLSANYKKQNKTKISLPLPKKKEKETGPSKFMYRVSLPLLLPHPYPHSALHLPFFARRLRDINKESSALVDPDEKPWGLILVLCGA